ncbi:MAG: phosphoglycerate dehydrogenase [Proteobacteria bacterium]|nr:phosphoglycerate dehydrogenase [Pseudomonadota bacterium]
MRYRVLISAPYAMSVIGRYRKALEAAGCEVVVAEVRERLSEAELMPLVGEVDGIICGDDQITSRVIAAAPRLRTISKWGTGIDSIDLEAAKLRGVSVRNTPNAFSEPLADTVLGYMLLFARRLDVMNRDIRAGRWVKPQLFALREKTLGVIGVGNCGKAVIRRAAGFGIAILAHDIVLPPTEFLDQYPIRMTTLNDTLEQADFITLHPSLNFTTRHLIDDAAFARMKPTAFLINTARGPIVEEAALVRALAAKRIAGAALDVFEEEPLPEDSPLRGYENVFFAPHNANSSPAAAERVHENTIVQLLADLQSGAARSHA